MTEPEDPRPAQPELIESVLADDASAPDDITGELPRVTSQAPPARAAGPAMPKKAARRSAVKELRAGRRVRRRQSWNRSFTSRNPAIIGAVGLVLVVVGILVAFNVSSLPFVGGGTPYTAAFTEAGGLKPNDDVRVAGLKVGTVQSVSLDGNKVKVSFRIKHAFVGDRSVVSVEIKTLLGQKFLSIDSEGTRAQDSGKTIPESRTVSAYDIYPALTTLTQTVGQINTTQLAQAFESVANAFRGTPPGTRQFVNGLSAVSKTIAARDQQLNALVTQAKGVTGVLANRDQQLKLLLGDGSALLDAINDRRAAVDALLTGTANLAANLQGLVNDNQGALKPALAKLDSVIAILQRNRSSLDQGLVLLAPYFRVITNAAGNGPWIDGYAYNLTRAGILQELTGSGPGA